MDSVIVNRRTYLFCSVVSGEGQVGKNEVERD